MAVLNPGVDIEMFRPGQKNADLMRQLRISRDAYVLLSVGRLDLHKGHDVVLQALSKLRGVIPQLVYIIVGDGPERGRLEGWPGSSVSRLLSGWSDR